MNVKVTNKPLLSICIPTYNRCTYLEKTIDSIVSNLEFKNGKIELVISDNASTDDTENVVNKYLNQYDNIIYSKNEENIKDRNFPSAIALANGVYRKLANDTLIFLEDSISIILDSVEKNMVEKPVLSFLNSHIEKKDLVLYKCANLDEFVDIVSYWSTWIGLFGIWEDDFNVLSDKYEGCDICLWQTSILFKILSKKKSIIINKKIVSIQEVVNKDLSYGVFRVFGINYLYIFNKYLSENKMSIRTYNVEKKRLLFNFFPPWAINFILHKKDYVLSIEDQNISILNNIYCRNWYYIVFYTKIYIKVWVKKVCYFIETLFN